MYYICKVIKTLRKMEDLLKNVNAIEKRIEKLDDRMKYYNDIKNALERSKNHLKLAIECMASAESYPLFVCIREKYTFELYGQFYKVDYDLYEFQDGSKDVEINFVYDAETKEEEKYLSRNIEEKLKQLILKQ